MRVIALLSLLCCFVLPDNSQAQEASPAVTACGGPCITVQQFVCGSTTE